MKRLMARRGSILILALFFMVIMAMLATAMIALMPTELRSAVGEHQQTRGSYAAEAGIIQAAKLIRSGTALTDLPGTTGTLDAHWSWAIINVEQLPGDSIRITTEGRKDGRAKRQVVAILENEEQGIQYAFYFEGFQGGGTGNPNTAWPLDVPIIGDVYFNGVWKNNSSNHNFNGDPNAAPIQGVVYATQALSGSPLGDKYVGGGTPYSGSPAAADPDMYNTVYRDGVNGIVSDFPVNDLDDVNTVFTEITNDVLGGTTPSGLITVPTQPDGVTMSHGIFIDSELEKVDLLLTSTSGAVVSLDSGTGLPSIPDFNQTMRLSRTTGNGNNATTTNTDLVFVTVDGTSVGGNTYNSGTLVVVDNGGAVTNTYNFDPGDPSFLVLINGDVGGIQGMIKDKKTIAVAGSALITGEILKSDTPRGQLAVESPTAPILGFLTGEPSSVPGIGGGPPQGDMGLSLSTVTPDNNYYVYAHLMGMDKKLLSNPTNQGGPGLDIPNNGTFHLIGSFAHGVETTPGQLNTEMWNINQFGVLALDPNNDLPYWPTLASGGYKLRSYVDIAVGE